MKKILKISGVGLVMFSLMCAAFLFQVDARECVVLTHFGKPVRTLTEPGLYWRWPPPIQSVNRMDKRLRLYQTKMVEYLTGDKKNLIIEAFACWRITDPLKFFSAVATDNAAEQKLDDVLSTLIGSTLGDYEMANVVSIDPSQVKIGDIETALSQRATERLKEDYGIEVPVVGFSRISLPEDSALAVYRRMKAERTTIASQYRSEGQREAEKIKAQADLDKTKLLSEAGKQAAIIRGQGDEEAMRTYGDAYSKSPDFFRLLKSLEAYRTFLGDKTTLVLSTESELLKYMEANPAKP